MDKVCHRILYLDPASNAHFFANFDQVIKHRQTFMEKPGKIKKIEKKKQDRIISFSFKDKFELDHIEEKILGAETEVEKITGKLQEVDIMSNIDQMNHFCSLLKDAQERVHELYERWEYLEAKKEGQSL
ncbi:MAG: hypothetical protein A2328_03200 [Bdellovibrionales bacterium RIFOXYB2_FULL_36_6]|nr:MAG: hypothetical protein A2328_03200 [Bdellovibrionales bacterium RIFOXYB2_FULL_36_6]